MWSPTAGTRSAVYVRVGALYVSGDRPGAGRSSRWYRMPTMRTRLSGIFPRTDPPETECVPQTLIRDRCRGPIRVEES